MTHELTGVIHGKRIELNADPGLLDGQVVVVVVKAADTEPGINPKTGRPWGEGIRATAGAFADWPEAEQVMEEILRDRKRDFGRDIPE